MAYLVAAVWRTRGALPLPAAVDAEAPPVPLASTPPPAGDGVHDAVPDLAARVAALGLANPPEEGDASNDSASNAGTAQFDWPAYHVVWHETPIDEAITAMFAEFAVLHAEMSGYTCSTAPLPLTVDVGKCIADRAERFVTMYLTPILGPQHSTKVHKLLCHVMEAIRMHGNLNNGNAGVNERLHKDDKPYNARTNNGISDFTRQIVVQAQGARIILRRNAEEEESLVAGSDELAGDDDSDSDGEGLLDEGDARADASGAGGTAGTSNWATGSQPRAAVPPGDVADTAAARTPAYHLRRVHLSEMAQWPGLAGVADALDLPQDALVRISTRISFEAVFECGWTVTQLLYASPLFRGDPWYDFVLCTQANDASTLSVAEVRAIVRQPDGDVAVVADMAVVEGVANCPLVSRGCTRLAWSVPDGKTEVCLRVLPLSCIRRVLHVVPDFADLARRRGFDAEPAGWGDPVAERLAMRYFINAFYPWCS